MLSAWRLAALLQLLSLTLPEALVARDPTTIPLPKDWPDHIKSAVLHVISLAAAALVAARGRAAESRKSRVRLRAELAEAHRETSLLEEGLRLKDLRMGRVKPRRRPHYRSTERLAILELRAARGWNTAQAASRFQLRPVTVSEWMRRVDEGGERALVDTPEPVNRFPDMVRYIVRSSKAELCGARAFRSVAEFFCLCDGLDRTKNPSRNDFRPYDSLNVIVCHRTSLLMMEIRGFLSQIFRKVLLEAVSRRSVQDLLSRFEPSARTRLAHHRGEFASNRVPEPEVSHL